MSAENPADPTAPGLSPEETERQLALLRQPPQPMRLLRPGTLGDGIQRLDPDECASLETLAGDAARRGEASQFIPASGAATRMFGDLLAVLREEPAPAWRALEARAWKGDEPSRAVLRWMAELDRLPFVAPLQQLLRERGQDELETLRRRGRWQPLLEALLGADGLGYSGRPKALVPFHLQDGVPRSALAQHLATDAAVIADEEGISRFQVTVSPGSEACVREEVARIGRQDGTRYRVRVSLQDPTTATVALTEAGELARDASGATVLRPGGHGALLGNLATSETPIVYVRNIDNVLPAGELREASVRWRLRLAGLLIAVRHELVAALDRLTRDPPEPVAIAAARALLEYRFGLATSSDPAVSPDTARHLLVDQLDRPLRVCGMVRNTGEPGGGPFWVEHGSRGPSLQIVERAQLDLADPEQEAIWRASTHFNPVDLVCSLVDRRGRAYDLQTFVDPQAVIVTRKRIHGVPCRVLERPGLWNGAMARWNTIFVEIPRELFAPVKTVFDLLRPEHQG